MTLSGNIESFPLSEVLRLAARSMQSGLLSVESGGAQGRVYFDEGLLSYATSRDQDDLGGDLGRLGVIDPHKWYPVERGEQPISFALVDGRTEADVRRFLADRIADVLVRLLRSRHGRFDFTEQSDPIYITGQRFDVEDVLRGVETRVSEWAEIEAVIPVEDATVHIASDLGDRDEVTIASDTWRILAALGSASTVDGVADVTGLSDFVVARAMAGLVQQGLLEVRMTAATDAIDPAPPSEMPGQEALAEPITLSPAAAPSIVERALSAEGSPTPPPEEGGVVEIFGSPGDRSETSGW